MLVPDEAVTCRCRRRPVTSVEVVVTSAGAGRVLSGKEWPMLVSSSSAFR